MMDLIDRQALIKQLKDENIPFNADINEIINIQPSISFSKTCEHEYESLLYWIDRDKGDTGNIVWGGKALFANKMGLKYCKKCKQVFVSKGLE